MPDPDADLVHPEAPPRRLRYRALARLRQWGGRPVNVAESFVLLCHDQGTRLVDVLDRSVDLYQRSVEAQEAALELQRQQLERDE